MPAGQAPVDACHRPQISHHTSPRASPPRVEPQQSLAAGLAVSETGRPFQSFDSHLRMALARGSFDPAMFNKINDLLAARPPALDAFDPLRNWLSSKERSGRSALLVHAVPNHPPRVWSFATSAPCSWMATGFGPGSRWPGTAPSPRAQEASAVHVRQGPRVIPLPLNTRPPGRSGSA